VAVAVLLGQVSISLVDLRIGGPVLVLALGLALLLGGATGPERDAEVDRTGEAGGPAVPDEDAR
jgi:hypothetical protein